MRWHALWLLPFFAAGSLPTRRFLLGAFALHYVDATFMYHARPMPKLLWKPVIERLHSR